MVEIPNKNKRFFFYCHSTQDKYMNVATWINAMELRQQHSTYSITADQIERRTKKKKKPVTAIHKLHDGTYMWYLFDRVWCVMRRNEERIVAYFFSLLFVSLSFSFFLYTCQKQLSCASSVVICHSDLVYSRVENNHINDGNHWDDCSHQIWLIVMWWTVRLWWLDCVVFANRIVGCDLFRSGKRIYGIDLIKCVAL